MKSVYIDIMDKIMGAYSTEDILDYIAYAKEKGCSMTGPEDPEIEYLNVLE